MVSVPLNAVRNERGSVLVVFAVAVPTFILIAALALDFGSWYAHKREVQNQVDAAAFAAGVAYGYNFPACTSSSGASDNIRSAALQYGKPPYNGSTSNITVNSDPCQPHSSGDYATPAGTMWTDVGVKTQVATLFGGFGFSPTISSSARVAVMKIKSATQFRPMAIANPEYRGGECAWAVFNNTGSGTVRVPLSAQGPGVWTGRRSIRLSSSDVTVDAVLGDCSSSQDQVTYHSVGYIGAYDQGSAGSEPKLQDFFVSSFTGGVNGCLDVLFVSRYARNCNFQLSAEINWGNNRRPVGVSANGTAFTGAESSWNGTLSFAAGSGEPGNGTIPIRLVGRYRNLNNQGRPVGPVRTYQFGQVQAVMAGNDQHEGPINTFNLSQVSAHDNQNVDETIELHLDQLGGTRLTVVRAGGGGDGMLTGAVDCADSQSFSQQLAFGCKSSFQIHPQSLCSGAVTAPPNCIQGANSSGSLASAYNALWAPGGNCSRTPNRWSSYPNIPRGDPRLITVPVTRVGSSFSPGALHPVISFAAMYVTGWRGMPSGCGDQDAAATAAATADLGNEVWGHFVRFVTPSSTGAPQNSGTSSDACPVTTTDIAACIATLVQ
jgi:hypothetical protein